MAKVIVQHLVAMLEKTTDPKMRVLRKQLERFSYGTEVRTPVTKESIVEYEKAEMIKEGDEYFVKLS